MTKAEFEEKAKKLKEAVDAAKKEYDKVRLGTDKDAESAVKKREQQHREEDRMKEQRRKLGLELVALQQENDEAEVEVMEEGLQKKIRRIREEYKARKAAADKQRSDWRTQNAQAGMTGLGSTGLLTASGRRLNAPTSSTNPYTRQRLRGCTKNWPTSTSHTPTSASR